MKFDDELPQNTKPDPFSALNGNSRGNCWRFAVNDPAKIYGESPEPDSVNPIPDKGQKFTCENIMAGLREKGAIPLPSSKCCPLGYRKIKLVVQDKWWSWIVRYNYGNDYHFYREDEPNLWRHKPGAGEVQETTDPDGDAKKRGYNVNCGDVCLPEGIDLDV